jgi:hypothetical protein
MAWRKPARKCQQQGARNPPQSKPAPASRLDTFSGNLHTMLQVELKKMQILKDTHRQLLLSGLTYWEGQRIRGQSDPSIQAKRWVMPPLPKPNLTYDDITISGTELKLYGVKLDYRPFIEETERYLISTPYWHTLKNRTANFFGSIQVSQLYFYVSQKTKEILGVGVFVANFMPNFNIELIFQTEHNFTNAVLPQKHLIPDLCQYHTQAYVALEEVNYDNLVKFTTTSEHDQELLANLNPLAYIEIQMMKGYSFKKTNRLGEAMKVYQQLEKDACLIMEGFTSSAGSVNLARLMAEYIGFGQPTKLDSLDEDDETACCICYEHVMDTTIIPCNHRLCCGCAAAIQAKGMLCPFCRGTIVEYNVDDH